VHDFWAATAVQLSGATLTDQLASAKCLKFTRYLPRPGEESRQAMIGMALAFRAITSLEYSNAED
jgi:hypothetical protein